MMTRMVLVGLVAALGITIPTWPEIQGWMRAAHTWTAGCLAAWDASGAGESFPIPVSAWPERPRPVFEPIVPEDRASGLADELNRLAEGLDLPAGAMSPRHRRLAVGPRATATARMRDESAHRPDPDATSRRLEEEWLSVAGPMGEIESPEAPIAARRAREFVPTIVCTFTRSTSPAPASPARVERRATSPTAGRVARSLLPPAPIEPMTDRGTDIAAELNRFAEGIEVPPIAQVAAPAPGRTFEPIDPTAGGTASLADALNRASEGLDLAPTAAGRPATIAARRIPNRPASSTGGPAPPGAPLEVARAVRLTGEAVRAWMDVMAGPAVFQVSAR